MILTSSASSCSHILVHKCPGARCPVIVCLKLLTYFFSSYKSNEYTNENDMFTYILVIYMYFSGFLNNFYIRTRMQARVTEHNGICITVVIINSLSHSFIILAWQENARSF